MFNNRRRRAYQAHAHNCRPVVRRGGAHLASGAFAREDSPSRPALLSTPRAPGTRALTGLGHWVEPHPPFRSLRPWSTEQRVITPAEGRMRWRRLLRAMLETRALLQFGGGVSLVTLGFAARFLRPERVSGVLAAGLVLLSTVIIGLAYSRLGDIRRERQVGFILVTTFMVLCGMVVAFWLATPQSPGACAPFAR